MTDFTPARLATDFRAARDAGARAAAATSDVGSVSADLVHIAVGPEEPLKRRTPSFDEAVGYATYRTTGFWRGYLIRPEGTGIASARLASAEAMVKLLRERGWGAHVYYARD